MRRLRSRYGHAAKTKHELLRDAMRDWRSGRAYVANGKYHRYMLRPVVQDHGVWVLGQGRAVTAPWSKAANEEWGHDSEGLHKEARAAYPEEAMSDFQRMHRLDPVRSRLLAEIGEEGA